MINEKHINYKNYHDMLYKYETLDINSIQYHLIHIRITHPANMHFDLEIYMIIITSWIENMTCSTLPILSDICAWCPFSDVPQCVFLLSEKIGTITHDTCTCKKYIYNSTLK